MIDVPCSAYLTLEHRKYLSPYAEEMGLLVALNNVSFAIGSFYESIFIVNFYLFFFIRYIRYIFFY